MANAQPEAGGGAAEKSREGSSATGHVEVTSLNFKLDGNIERLEWALSCENISRNVDLRLYNKDKEIQKLGLVENIRSVSFEVYAREVFKNAFTTQRFTLR
jgi:hypothetical protein